MALTLTKVADCTAVKGPAMIESAWQVVPGLSDYPSGGYPITSAELGLGNLYGARVIAGNAIAALATPKFVLAAGDFGSDPHPDSTINMEVTVADEELSPDFDISACKWIVMFEAAGE